MTVTVQLFARARDLASAAAVAVEVLPGASVRDLKDALAAQVPALAGLLERCAIAVNSEFAEDAVRLEEWDEIALLPPVSGG